jgi:hypothetical protein
MTTINLEEATIATVDDTLRSCRSKVEVNESFLQEKLIRSYPIQTAGTEQGPGLPIAYNGAQVNFEYQLDAGWRIRFDKSYIVVRYLAANVGVPAPYGVISPLTTSIPWNTPAALFNKANYGLNASNVIVENYDDTFMYGNMIKILSQYSAPALEAASDRFFTPCIEETRDANGVMSTASSDRATAHLITPGIPAATPAYGTKIIMLADIFDSLRATTAWHIKKFRMQLGVKPAADILFQVTAPAPGYIPRFYVTTMELRLSLAQLSKEALEREVAFLEKSDTMTNQFFSRYEALNLQYTPSMTYQEPSIRNMVATALLFPSDRQHDQLDPLATGNYLQFTYGENTVGTGITSYQHIYKSILSPEQPVSIFTVNKSANSDLFQMWRLLTNTQRETITAPTLDFLKAMGHPDAGGADKNPYVMFPGVFFNLEGYPTTTNSGSTHRITTTGGNATSVVLVRVRLQGVQVVASNEVNIMY